MNTGNNVQLVTYVWGSTIFGKDDGFSMFSLVLCFLTRGWSSSDEKSKPVVLPLGNETLFALFVCPKRYKENDNPWNKMNEMSDVLM